MDDRLRKFASVVDTGSFTKAAHELHISQPALSTAINKLERELHTKLLIRKGKSLELTEAGKFAYATAKELDIQTQNLVRKIVELEHDEPSVTLGMIDSVANAFFATEINFGVLNDISRLSVVVNNSRYLIRAIERDEIDLAFITHQQAGRLPSLIESIRLASESMLLVCHPDLNAMLQAELKQGVVLNFVSYDKASTTNQIVLNGLKEYGLTPEVSYYSSSPEVILRLVLLRKGTAVLPNISVADYVNDGRLLSVGNPQQIIIKRDISLIYRRDKVLSPQLERIISHAQQLIS